MKRYKISDKVIALLVNPKMGKTIKDELEMLFNCSPQSINSWIRYNNIDGPLTREAVLQVIEKNYELDRNEVLHEINTVK